MLAGLSIYSRSNARICLARCVMAGQRYDVIAPRYESVKELPVVKYMEAPTLFYILGDIEGKSILDLACGTGYYSRLFVRSGAERVVGVDISGEMLSVARAIEKEQKQNITYYQYDASELKTIGTFDLVTGIFLLNNASTPEALLGMCRNVYNNLDDGGTFVGVAVDPDYTLVQGSQEQYGFEVLEQSPMPGGSVLQVELSLTSPVRVENYQWSRQSCEWALEEAGFERIAWRPFFVSSEGIEKYGWDFWGPFLKKPPLTFILCHK